MLSKLLIGHSMEAQTSPLPEALVTLIYDTALNPGLWSELLEATSQYINLLERSVAEQQLPSLLAHLEKSLTIGSRLDGADTQAAIQQQVLDQLPLPCLLLSDSTEIQLINQHAKQLLAQPTLISIHEKHLKIADRRLQQQFNQAIAQLLDPQCKEQEQTLVIQERYQPHPMNLKLSRVIEPSTLKTNVLIFIAGAGHGTHVTQDRLDIFAAHYLLTPSESELVGQLMKEKKLSQIATDRHVSINTVRTQLKSVFAKTDTHRQVELIKLVLKQSLGTQQCSGDQLDRDQKANELHRSVTLNHGRQLGYSDVGPRRGLPLVMVHPSTGSRLQQHPQFSLLYDKGIRLITPERPGFGLSSPDAEGTMASFAQDVEALLDHLEIEHFSLAGFCGGAAFTLAMSQHFNERVHHTSLISPTTPFNPINLLHGVMGSNNLMTSIALKSPNMLYHLAAFLARNVRIEPERYFDQIFPHLCDSDAAALSEPEVTTSFLTAFREAVRQGPTPFANEIKMLAKPWPVALGKTPGTVTIWHGNKDAHVSIFDVRQMAAELPDCELKEFAGYGHFMVYHLWSDILDSVKSRHRQVVESCLS